LDKKIPIRELGAGDRFVCERKEFTSLGPSMMDSHFYFAIDRTGKRCKFNYQKLVRKIQFYIDDYCDSGEGGPWYESFLESHCA